MDGSLAPEPTYYNGSVEALTATPAFFALSGWLGTGSYPRLGGTINIYPTLPLFPSPTCIFTFYFLGTVFVEQFKVAALYRPLFLVINQVRVTIV
jgi:hypothetical protein